MTSLFPCGTHAAYQRHLRHDETPCQRCRAGNARHQRELQRTNPVARTNGKAARKAATTLARRYPDEFAALVTAEMAHEPDGSRASRERARMRALRSIAQLHPEERQALIEEYRRTIDPTRDYRRGSKAVPSGDQ